MAEFPRLSHLQFLVLGIVQSGSTSGRDVRTRLQAFGLRKTGPAFYQLMARMEDRGWVEGEYHQQIVDGQIIRERHYRITGDGAAAWNRTSEFYSEAIDRLGPLASPSGA